MQGHDWLCFSSVPSSALNVCICFWSDVARMHVGDILRCPAKVHAPCLDKKLPAAHSLRRCPCQASSSGASHCSHYWTSLPKDRGIVALLCGQQPTMRGCSRSAGRDSTCLLQKGVKQTRVRIVGHCCRKQGSILGAGLAAWPLSCALTCNGPTKQLECHV